MREILSKSVMLFMIPDLQTDHLRLSPGLPESDPLRKKSKVVLQARKTRVSLKRNLPSPDCEDAQSVIRSKEVKDAPQEWEIRVASVAVLPE